MNYVWCLVKKDEPHTLVYIIMPELFTRTYIHIYIYIYILISSQKNSCLPAVTKTKTAPLQHCRQANLPRGETIHVSCIRQTITTSQIFSTGWVGFHGIHIMSSSRSSVRVNIVCTDSHCCKMNVTSPTITSKRFYRLQNHTYEFVFSRNSVAS